MRYVCLFALILPALSSAQDGAAIYKERCASCHDTPAERVPSISAIKAMSGEAIYAALTHWLDENPRGRVWPSRRSSRSSATSLRPAARMRRPQLSPTKTCKGDAISQRDGGVQPHQLEISERLTATAADVPKLKLKWAFNLGDVTMARSQPVIVGGRVFIPTLTGAVYALDADTGCTRWGFQAAAGVRSGVTVGEANGAPAIFFGDGGATMYALNAESGELIWKIRPVDHFATTVTATPRFYKGVVYQSIASFEEVLGGDPKFECCTFRGSVVALDASTGKKIWQTFTIQEPAKPTEKTKRERSSTVPPAPPSGRARPSTSSLAFSTSPRETTIPTHRPIPVTRSWPWTSRPESCSGPNSSPRTTLLTSPAPHHSPRIARTRRVRISTSASRRFWSI